MTNTGAEKKQLPAFAILAIISLVAALALALTNAITEGPIRELEMKAQREAFGVVLSADEYVTPDGFNAEDHSITTLVEAKTGGKTVGYCVVASVNGYAGPVAVTLGVGSDGKITGAKIGDTNFVETNGFGSRWLAEDKWEQFKGIDVTAGGSIEALSGATVTSTAVLNAANNALAAVNTVMGSGRTEPVLAFGVAEKAPVEQMELTGDVLVGTARGFQSDVTVKLTMDAAGAISGIVIDSANETAGFGTRCMEDAAFAAQFVGKTAPVAIGEGIDALAGATVTSKAVVEAVNAAVAAPASAGEDAVAAPTEEPFAPMTLTGEIKEGAAKGFQSDVKVQLTVDDAGAITGLVIDSASETPNFGTRCGETADYINQFIGKTAPVTADALSGATVTSNAVVSAINAALAPAAAEPTAEPTAEPAAETPAAENALTAAAPGFNGADVGVTVTLNADGTIATLDVDVSKQLPPVCDACAAPEFVNQFIGKTGPFVKGENIDAVAGATFTTDGVIAAVNAALASVAAPAEVEAEPTAEPTAEPAAETPADLTATVPGFKELDVVVTVTLNEDGTIATLTVNADTQSPGLGKKCAEEAFLSQFIGKTGPFALGESIDAVSYATITSQAVVDAVNALLAK